MTRSLSTAVLLVLFIPLLMGLGPHPSSALKSIFPSQSRPFTKAAGFGQLPMIFEPNEGQTDPQVKYMARGRELYPLPDERGGRLVA